MKRILRGIASTASEDRHGDVVPPTALKWALPIPLLWNHHHDEVIGTVREITREPSQIRIVGEIVTGLSRADSTWTLIEGGFELGLSISFLGKKYEPRKEGGLHWLDAELLEISVVAVPSNRQSRILTATSKGASIKLVSARDSVPGHPGAIRIARS